MHVGKASVEEAADQLPIAGLPPGLGGSRLSRKPICHWRGEHHGGLNAVSVMCQNEQVTISVQEPSESEAQRAAQPLPEQDSLFLVSFSVLYSDCSGAGFWGSESPRRRVLECHFLWPSMV